MLEEVLWPGLGLLTETAKTPTAEAVAAAVSGKLTDVRYLMGG